jgi:uncharacterized HAD superfamily protein
LSGGKKRELFISIDIDGVLARRNRKAYIQACNTLLNLSIAEEEAEKLSYQDFLLREEVLVFKQKVGEQIACKQLGWVDFHHSVLKVAKVVEGAKEGVQYCNKVTTHNLFYYTARYSPLQTWNRAMQSATHAWLASQAFPCSENVVFCLSFQDKMAKLAQHAQQNNEAFLHIDDSWRELAVHLSAMPEHFRLVAFGVKSTDILPSRVYSLPGWHEIGMLLTEIQQGEVS